MRTMDTPAPPAFRPKPGKRPAARPRVADPAPIYEVTSRFASAESAAAAACILLAQPALWECLHAASAALTDRAPKRPRIGDYAAALILAGVTAEQIEQADHEARALDAALRSWIGWVHADNRAELAGIAAGAPQPPGKAEKRRPAWWQKGDLEKPSEQV